MRNCTTHAIRIRNGLPRLIEDRCIDCGECVRTCQVGAIVARTSPFIDLARYEYLLAVVGPELLVQFKRDVGSQDVAIALHGLGFDAVVELDRAFEANLLYLSKLLLDPSTLRPIISSDCPTVVRLIQTLHPELIENLILLKPPRETTAERAKREVMLNTGIPKHLIGAVYLSPCTARIIDIESSRSKTSSAIDAIIPVADIYSDILTALSKLRRQGALTGESSSSISSGQAILGGQSRSLRRLTNAMQHRNNSPKKTSINFVPIAQIHSIQHIFEEAEKGRLQNVDFLECYTCPEGCVGGSLMVDNPYVSRSKAVDLLRQLPSPEDSINWELAEDDLAEDSFKQASDVVHTPVSPLDPDFRRSIKKLGEREDLLKTMPGIDCGACGAPSCASLADDIVRDIADIKDCVVMQVKARDKQTGEKWS